MVVQEQMRKKNFGKMKILLNDWKEENLKIIITRMKGWQLETFKESYDHKKNKVFLYLKKSY